MSKKKIVVGIIVGLLAVVLIAAIVFFLRMRQMMASMGPVEQTYTHENHGSGSSVVYMTTDISPEGLMAAYEALNWTPTGKAAVKLSTGEPPASNYLDPNLIKTWCSWWMVRLWRTTPLMAAPAPRLPCTIR